MTTRNKIGLGMLLFLVVFTPSSIVGLACGFKQGCIAFAVIAFFLTVAVTGANLLGGDK
jgi:hypothetical protein